MHRLVARAVKSVLNDLPIILRELFWTGLHGELVDRAREAERDVVISIVDPGPCIHADIESLVVRNEKGDSVRNFLRIHVRTIHSEYACATFRNSGAVVS